MPLKFIRTPNGDFYGIINCISLFYQLAYIAKLSVLYWSILLGPLLVFSFFIGL